jgi:hypothetical protein
MQTRLLYGDCDHSNWYVIIMMILYNQFSIVKKEKSKATPVTDYGGLHCCDIEDPTISR